jgi:hypothetical protein
MHHLIEFIKSGRGKARSPANPSLPRGIVVDMSKRATPSCTVDLPYPAPECGQFHVRCTLCNLSLIVSAAGRPDDPTQVIIACKIRAATM